MILNSKWEKGFKYKWKSRHLQTPTGNYSKSIITNLLTFFCVKKSRIPSTFSPIVADLGTASIKSSFVNSKYYWEDKCFFFN